MTPYKLPAEMKTKLVEALRSGKYTQTTGSLRDDKGFCCLGVVCDIVDPTAWKAPVVGSYSNRWDHFGCQAFPSTAVGRAFGMEVSDKHDYYVIPRVTIDGVELPLDAHNDAGRTFEQIAKAIEEQL